MAIMFKGMERSATTPIPHSPTGATLGPAAHLLIWGKAGNTSAQNPSFYTNRYFTGSDWNGYPDFSNGYKNAVPCILPYTERLSWNNFNIENFAMGNDCGFGIGTRYQQPLPGIFGVTQTSNILAGDMLEIRSSFYENNKPHKILIFINQQGMTLGGFNNTIEPPLFVKQYIDNNNYISSLRASEQEEYIMDSSYFDMTNVNYRLKELNNYNLLTAGTYHFMMGYGNTLYAWGNNDHNQCNIPANATSTINLKQITAGNAHSLALYYTSTNGSTLVQWGATSASIPSSIGTGAIQIASGFCHSIALTGTGGVVCWGNNDFNQCNVPVGLTGITYIAAGHYHSMAIKTDGTVYCWGLTASGQCSVPASVGTGGYRIAGGLDHTILMKKNGTVIGWGGNTSDQITLPNRPSEKLFNNNYNSIAPSVNPYSQWPVDVPGSVRDIRCGKYSSIAFHTGKIMWYTKFIKDSVIDQNFNRTSSYIHFTLLGIDNQLTNTTPRTTYSSCIGLPYSTAGNCFDGPTMWIVVNSGYSAGRHDIYVYNNTPLYPDIPGNYPNSPPTGYQWPIGRNGSFYNTSGYGLLSGGTVGNTGCWSFGFGDNGIFRQYDFFAPPDFSGVGLRARTLGNYNVNYMPGFDPNKLVYNPSLYTEYGNVVQKYSRQNQNNRSDINYYNNIFPALLISKKHFICVAHWAWGTTQWQTSFMRRDGRTFSVTGNLIFRCSSAIGEFPDINVYEMQTEISQDDANNIAIYNKWADYSKFTPLQLIDPQQVVLKGITSGFTSGTFEISRQIGRKIWGIDGQDRAITLRTAKSQQISNAYGKGYVLNHCSSGPSVYEPLQCGFDTYVGDSGSPFFITGYGHTYHAKYDSNLGITLQPTIFLGWNTTFRESNMDSTLIDPIYPYNLFYDYGSTGWTQLTSQKSTIELINEVLQAAGQELIEHIPVYAVQPSWPPYILPITGACANPNEITSTIGQLRTTFPDFSYIKSNITGADIIATGTINYVDKNILTLSGISGSFVTDSVSTYAIAGGTAGASYNKINPFTTPLNNGLGTTAGVGSILNNEAAGYTFDSNDPFEIFNG
jgi:hypothetical protein